ncbi:hypothetical protein BWQ96_05877 [Gracilariopsis chorda]|uniref:Uncharacterized protein n=1 Tax=Gracilariopsis chorda TaxID=448386 RepID=A0A2V3IRL3_9FLOR|nr:hypothetical protein BWQ96_05877 [Gracilariopsis chorda]|eukprot:PXF44357.1 hypothetical protein BWQ96_05877 [Gracilariopsis chorda]
MHRLAWTQKALALEGLRQFFESGLNVLSSWKCPYLTQRGTSSTMPPVDSFGTNQTITAKTIQNPNSGLNGPRNLRRSYAESIGRNSDSCYKNPESNPDKKEFDKGIDRAINTIELLINR